MGRKLSASDSKLPRKIRPNWAAGEPQTSQAAKMSKVALDDDVDDSEHDDSAYYDHDGIGNDDAYDVGHGAGKSFVLHLDFLPPSHVA